MKRPVKLTLAALILVCAGSVAWLLLAPGRTDHPVAAITLDGEVLDEIDLTQVQEPYSFPVTGKDGLTNTVLVEPGRIRVEKADCPDQICVHMDWLEAAPIVCLPNRLSIQYADGESVSGLDAGSN